MSVFIIEIYLNLECIRIIHFTFTEYSNFNFCQSYHVTIKSTKYVHEFDRWNWSTNIFGVFSLILISFLTNFVHFVLVRYMRLDKLTKKQFLIWIYVTNGMQWQNEMRIWSTTILLRDFFFSFLVHMESLLWVFMRCVYE